VTRSGDCVVVFLNGIMVDTRSELVKERMKNRTSFVYVRRRKKLFEKVRVQESNEEQNGKGSEVGGGLEDDPTR
jgi:hypothetical protein